MKKLLAAVCTIFLILAPISAMAKNSPPLAKAASVQMTSQIDAGTMVTIDRVMAKPTELSEAEQARAVAQTDLLRAHTEEIEIQKQGKKTADQVSYALHVCSRQQSGHASERVDSPPANQIVLLE